MIRFLVFLLLVWIAISILGAVIEGLIWLTIVGLVLIAGTAVLMWLKRNTGGPGQ